MDFLQSKIWMKFQASVGRKVFDVDNISIIEHQLPIVGKYFYIPRGPEKFSEEIINLAQKEKIGWIRIEPETENALDTIKNSLECVRPRRIGLKIRKAPHDMQPRETLVIDISKSEEEILAGMKQKTRYNLNLAKKKNIKIIVSREKKYVDEFLRLVKITSLRDGITAHPEEYYRKMVENIPEENLKLYLAKYDGKIIVANIMIFFQDIAIYLHGASDNEYRNIMAPYLLQWQQSQDAKKFGCTRYDFGGIKTGDEGKSWAGITKFKLGFSPNTQPTRFPGCYDIMISPLKYKTYRIIQKIKALI